MMHILLYYSGEKQAMVLYRKYIILLMAPSLTKLVGDINYYQLEIYLRNNCQRHRFIKSVLSKLMNILEIKPHFSGTKSSEFSNRI